MIGVVASVLVSLAVTLPVASAPATDAGAPLDLSLHVSKTEALDPDGDTVTVTGSGYDEQRGIYGMDR